MSNDQRVRVDVSRQNESSGQRLRVPADRFRYTPSIYAALLLAMLTVVAWNILAQLEWLLILLYLSVLVACGIAGPVAWMERRGLNRAISILIVFGMVATVVGVIVWFAVPPLVRQTGALIDDIPDYISHIERLRIRWLELEETYPALAQLEERLITLSGRIGSWATGILLNLPATIAKAMFAVTSILTFAFLFLMSWERMKRGVLMLVHPRHRGVTDQVLGEIGLRLGAYLRAKVIVMTIIGTWIYVTLMLLDTPYALLTAIFAALMEALPRIGPWIGRAAIVLTVLPLGVGSVIIAVVSHVIIENIKGFWLSPLVEGHVVDIHPLTAFISVIAGGLLLGWVGALVAVPTAAAIQAVIELVVIPWRRRQLAPAEAEVAPTVDIPPTP
jgi:predicted PurR-regulated permease PerM